MPHESTLQDIRKFYQLMDHLEKQLGGTRTLSTASGRMHWPQRGVYFFFEPGETRSTSGAGYRMVRIETHGLIQNSKSTLWGRLRQYKGFTNGQFPNGDNHRGSVFRHHVGTALIKRDQWDKDVARTWGIGNTAPKYIRENEYPLEREVSRHIRSMPFMWLAVDDDPGPDSMRGYIERNTIALLSNFNRQNNPIDPPSETWLGNWAAHTYILKSGFWNINHVADGYDPVFMQQLERYITNMN